MGSLLRFVLESSGYLARSISNIMQNDLKHDYERIQQIWHMRPLYLYPVWVMVPASVSIVISRPGSMTAWLEEYCKDWPAF